MKGILSMLAAPWAIVPNVFEEMVGIYDRWARGEKPDIDAIRAATGKPLKNERTPYEIVDGVAVIPVAGEISKRMNMLTEMSGGTSIELLRSDFREALGREDVKAILLDVDSPGGAVDGTVELAAEIYAARGTKPMAAFGDGLIASAAYWIGAAADEVYLGSPVTQAGSIGVLSLHRDVSKAEDMAGVKTSVITAGKYKALPNRYEPLNDEGRAVIQGMLDEVYSLFVDDVARFRGRTTDEVLEKMADGRVFTGKQAVANGLADGIMGRDELIQRLAGTARGTAVNPGANARKTGGGTMQGMTLETLRAEHPDIVTALLDEGRTAGLEEGKRVGADTERARIKAVEAQSMPGHEALIASLKFDGKTTGPEAAVQVLGAEKAKNATLLATLETEGATPAKASLDTDTVKAIEDAKTPEEKWEAAWERDADLRAEFCGAKGTYLAYMKNEAAARENTLKR